jgi:hypothetical protein
MLEAVVSASVAHSAETYALLDMNVGLAAFCFLGAKHARVLELQMASPVGAITITPPSPPLSAGNSEWIMWSAACCGDCPCSTRLQVCLANVSRMKYSPTPVPETAQERSLVVSAKQIIVYVL